MAETHAITLYSTWSGGTRASAITKGNYMYANLVYEYHGKSDLDLISQIRLRSIRDTRT